MVGLLREGNEIQAKGARSSLRADAAIHLSALHQARRGKMPQCDPFVALSPELAAMPCCCIRSSSRRRQPAPGSRFVIRTSLRAISVIPEILFGLPWATTRPLLPYRIGDDGDRVPGEKSW